MAESTATIAILPFTAASVENNEPIKPLWSRSHITYNAQLFNKDNVHIGKDLKTYLAFSSNHHMTGIRVHAYLPPLKNHNEDEDEISTYIEGIASDERRVTMYINYQSLLKGCKAFKVFVEDGVRPQFPPTEEMALSTMSTDMRTIICNLDARRRSSSGDSDKAQSIYLELHFDPSKVAYEKVWAGVPKWGQDVADLFKSGCIHVIIENASAAFYCLQAVSREIEMNKAGFDPLNVWHKSHTRTVFLDTHTHNEPNFPEGFPQVPLKEFEYSTYYPRFAYHDFKEYATVTHIGCKLERMIEEKPLLRYQEKTQSLYLTSLPKEGDGVYFGFLSRPESRLRLDEGTRIKVTFDAATPGDEAKQPWIARIASTRTTYSSEDLIPVYVHRPLDDDTTQPILVRRLSRDTVDHPSTIGNKVHVKVLDFDFFPERKMNALELLNSAPEANPELPWNRNLRNLLVSHRPQEHQATDVFKLIRDQDAEFEKALDLTDEQRSAIMNARDAPSGVVLVEGLPGTGKKHIAVMAATPFFKSTSVHTVLAVGPTNVGVDALARLLQDKLAEMQRRGKASKLRYVVRLNSLSAETAMLKAGLNVNRPPNTTGRRQRDIPEDPLALASLSEVDDLLHDVTTADFENRSTGLADKRFKEPHLSIGHRMLQVAGVHECSISHPDKSRFDDFRSYLRYYADGKRLTAGEILDFKFLTDELYKYVLSNASAVVATPAVVSLPRNLSVLQDTTGIILFDEFARLRDDDIMPLMAARMKKCAGIIGFGDTRQLRPTVLNQRENNPYAGALGLSFMTRLVQQGFPCSILREQAQMGPQLSAVARELGYPDILADAPEVASGPRPLTQAFADFNKQWANTENQSIVFFDIRGADAHTISVDYYTKSRSCEKYAKIIINNVASFLAYLANKGRHHGTIGIITAYRDQEMVYVKAVDEMHRQRIKGCERISVHTIESSQGGQFDWVFADILIDEETVGFLKELPRLNVLMTRAKHGMHIVGSGEMLMKSEGGRGRITRAQKHPLKLFTLLYPYRYVIDLKKDAPITSRFFNEPRIGSAWVSALIDDESD